MPRYLVEHYIWAFVRVFPMDWEESPIRLRKVNCPPQCGWASTSLLKAWKEQKAEEGRVLSLSDCLRWVLVFSWPWTGTIGIPASQVYTGQTVGFLSFPNHMSQSLLINFFTHRSLILQLLPTDPTHISVGNPPGIMGSHAAEQLNVRVWKLVGPHFKAKWPLTDCIKFESLNFSKIQYLYL